MQHADPEADRLRPRECGGVYPLRSPGAGGRADSMSPLSPNVARNNATAMHA
jgi:hypothetical protein